MFAYQRQDSSQTLCNGMEEYFEAYRSQFATRASSPEADSFFRCHDVCHVLFGCDISLRDEMIVKISSLFGTTEGWRVLEGYRLPASKEIYSEIRLAETLRIAAMSIWLIPRTIWRCTRLHDRWPWNDYEQYLNMPLGQIRREFGIRVAH